ncbi:disease resistance protein RGA2-like isoform X2 [Chenopodium quinoa]|uniref:disease resistance protein RGA2-like isoform X2 n=1 Tax=Chenopodium quinoa TaxID=63459 RepID=UPI000B77FD26|nr:disease resistance protein RGA2-like isoform X2 [Chenopodium quinoa]
MDVSGGLTLVQFVVEKLGSPIWTQIEAVLGLESELDKLRETMSTIEAVLLDAEVVERLHQACRTNVERNKLKRLKEALYRADDLLDEITTLAHLKKLMPCNNNKVCNEVCLFFSRSNQFRFASNWSREMKKISEMLDRIVNDHRYDIGSAGFDAANQMRINARETHSYVCEDDVFVGREEDKRKVIDMLLNNTVEQQDGLVVSIVGIGGLGKTTLAQQLYNDQMIVKKFPQRKWVCVSDAFDVKVIVGQILAAVNSGIDQDRLNLDQLQTKLRKEMDGKKYFLVLDDVWNEESSKWLQLRNVLIGGERVSRILVTTRSRMVADVVGSHWTHELEGLSDDESLDLFKKIALKPEENPVKQQLVDIGKEIVRKCANVPLAIRVVGSLLRGQEESKWENLKNTDLANIVQDESNGIIPVLKISYNYLPFHLKSCFSYCAVFPKDYKIIKEDLICLWMAQGFIMPSDAESFEDVGEEYFKQLLQRCFFQDVERAEGTKEIISCKMHDLIHDLAKEVAGTDILSCTYSTRCFNEKTRHVYMDESTPKDVVGKLRNMQRMRTFLCTGDRVFSLIPILGDVSKVKYLRVLCLNYCYGLQKLPSGIGEWVHLRYLDLSGNVHLCVLPSSITKLYNLQTLKLRGCRHLKRLPRELRKLVNLRHLDICGCWSLTCMPPGMSQLRHLKDLALKGLSEVEYMESSSINSGDDDELVFFPSLENLKLKNMPKLKGWWKSSSESEESETPHAPKLSRLDIYGCPELTTVPLFPGLQELYLEDFNEALGPIMRETTHGLSSSSVSNNNHKEDQGRQGKLREVKTDNVGYLTSLPIHSFHYLSYLWIGNDHQMEELKTGEVGEVFRSGRLSSLRSLAILDCKNLKSISGRGVWDQFTGLESLSLDLLPQLELEDEDDVINNKSTEAEMPWRYLAPTLRSLFLYCLPKVVKLPGGIGCLSSLHSLEIEECDNLESLTPSIGGLSSLHSLRIIDCNNLESLTPSIGGLSSLQSLTIDRCSKLKRMPEEMRHLTSLTELRIRRCSPVLMKECKNKNGANWSNIQHIPNIKLGMNDKIGVIIIIVVFSL